MVAVFTTPNLNNYRQRTLLEGVRHMATQYKTHGTALHSLQRMGFADSTTFPVSPPGGTRQLGSNMTAGPSMAVVGLLNPPIVAFASPMHTRMPKVML